MIAESAELTEDTLLFALLDAGTAEPTLVVGKALEVEAKRILFGRDDAGEPGPCFLLARLHVDVDRDPGSWELF